MDLVGVQPVAIDLIDVPERLRAVEPAWVEALAASIAETGLQQPIQVLDRGDGRYPLIAGAHRLEACRRLGHSVILGSVFRGSALEARLQEIDENLMRRELSPLHRAKFLAERKAVYEQLHPEARQGGNRRRRDQTDKMSVCSFAADAAERIGLSERHIRRQVALWHRLHPTARELLATLPIAESAVELAAFARLDQSLQKIIAHQLAAGQHRSVREALSRHSPTPAEAPGSVDARLVDAWRRSSRPARQAFLARLTQAGLIAGHDGSRLGEDL